jgi:[CysO sulfur-carrier protein]-S-L-cysteine hydrolase
VSTPFRLQLSQTLWDEMVRQALSERPNECCGLLAGVVEDSPNGAIGRVVTRYPLMNAAASPVEYASDPKEMFAAVRDMRRLGIDILAVYHSHPTSEPMPSRKDRERNYSPEVVNLIVSLTTDPPTVRGWWLTETTAREAECEIVS